LASVLADSDGVVGKAFVPTRTLPRPNTGSKVAPSIQQMQNQIQQLSAENFEMEVELQRMQAQFNSQADIEEPQSAGLKLGFGILALGVVGVTTFTILDKLVSNRQSRGAAPVMELQSSAVPARASVSMETLDDLKTLSMQLNPAVGYWDPLKLAEWKFFDTQAFFRGGEIGFLRHAEIKHGRVAMAGFVGYLVQANGGHWPWNCTGGENGISFGDISAVGSPPEQWDALPTSAKLQIILFVGFLEFNGENVKTLEASGMVHHMKGGRPGQYPSLKAGAFAAVGFGESGPVAPHPIPLDFVDPFGLQKKMSPEAKERALLVEINNGRLAMLGIFGFLAEAKIPGSVGLLSGVVKPYAGEIMAPFNASDAGLPFVKSMLSISPIQ